MQKKSFYTRVNGIDFYCEIRGEGPLLVIIPDGGNDCGAFDMVSSCLMNNFTVLSFDPRGGSRSVDNHPLPVTPRILADDAVSIIKKLGYEKASFYGSSSGGQGVLATALYYPDNCVNAIVHEAALQLDAPLPKAGFDYFNQVSTYAPYCNGFDPGEISSAGDYNKYRELDPECRERMDKNGEFWNKYYLGTVDSVSYSKNQLSKMKNVDFSVGVWSVAWCVYANIATAERGGFPYTWLRSAHNPHITCPEELGAYILKTCRKYQSGL